MKILKTSGAWLLAIALFLPTLAFAQNDGRFVGVVLDPSGAVVPGATVIVKNERTGEERSVKSNAEGRYIVSNLRPSVYTIRVTFGDLAPLEFTGLQLVAAQEFPLDLSLTPAGVSETVQVTATVGTVDLSSASLGVNVGERDVLNLPVNGRQMSQLMLQAPGSVNSGTGTWQDVRFSGRAIEQNAIRYDGVEGSSIIDAAPGNLNGEVASPFKLQASLENVQEFRVESSNYPAEYGTGTGGQVTVVTKSGSNNLHGSLFQYWRSDKFDAPNYFDEAAGLPKSKLSQNQFGGSVGGPLMKNKAFFFGSYEGYKLDAGVNFVEGVPSDAAWSRAVPVIANLRPGFLAPNAVILPGASANPDFDIAQLQGLQEVREHAFSGRFDLRMSNRWSMYVRAFHDQGTNNQPEGVTGRVVKITADPSNAVFNLQGVLSDSSTNEFKLGYNAAPTRINGIAPVVNGVDFGTLTLNLSGSVANTGIAGQGNSSGLAVPGGLVRANSATNGRGQPYDPYTMSIIDAYSSVRGSHLTKVGGEFRAIRMETDRLGGTTYSFANVTSFLANQATTVQYLGDVSAPSVFNNGATGARQVKQEYFIGYAQDEWHLGSKATLNYGLRYEYYTPLTEEDDLQVKFNIDTGVIDPNTTAPYQSRKNNFNPRVAFTYAPGKTVFRTGFGLFVGPGQTEDQIQPIEAERISTTLTSGALLAYPIDPAAIRLNFTANPNNRSYQPRAYANEYELPERVYQYTASVQQELGGGMAATAAYVGSQGRNLFLRSIANRTIGVQSNGASAATQIREFDIVTYGADGRVASIQRPYAEIDYKTSGGRDSYDAMQLALTRRSAHGLVMNAQYTFGHSRGTSGGSNEARTVGNNARDLEDFEYDYGNNNFDVRHTFNLSALYTVPGQGAWRGGWSVGGIVNARSGVPINLLITRPDIVYVDGAGTVWNAPAIDRTAVINTPSGGSSRSTRRPDVVPGVSPFIKDGGLLFLNPAAFATPQPGTFGNLERNAVHGPNFRQTDIVVAKRIGMGGGSNLELRAEIFNVFNRTNFSGFFNYGASGVRPDENGTLAFQPTQAGPARQFQFTVGVFF